MRRFFTLFILSFVIPFTFFAQCDEGFVSVEFRVFTDPWPYETYWQLNMLGSACGQNMIAEGGNTNVNCAGTAADNSPDGYGANNAYWEGPFCLQYGGFYNLIFVDSYGDGGLAFEVYENGVLTHLFIGEGAGNSWTIQPGMSNIPAYDQPCAAQEIVPNTGAVIMNSTNAIASYGEIAPPGGGCGGIGTWCEGASTKSVWAFFQAAEGESYEITTCGNLSGYDTQIALWKYSNCDDFSTYELISANDDMAGGCPTSNGYSSMMYASCLEPGIFYLIQVDGYYGDAGIFSLEVSSYEGEPYLNANVRNIDCPVNKGETPTGRIIPYIIGSGLDFTGEWTGPNGFSSGQNTIENLAPGEYHFTATTACGEVLTATYTINEPSYWNVFLSPVPPACQDSNNGSLVANVSGATAPYSYQWTGPGNFSSGGSGISNLTAGQYHLLVTDDNDCEFSMNYNLIAANDFVFDLGGPVTLCINETLTLTPPAVYDYLWFDGSDGDTYVIDAQSWGPGNHSITVTASNASGCDDVDTFSFFVEDCVNVEERESAMQIYPNPWNDALNIRFPKALNSGTIRLIDTAGRVVVEKQGVTGSTFRLEEEVASGVYQLIVVEAGAIYSHSVIKQ